MTVPLNLQDTRDFLHTIRWLAEHTLLPFDGLPLDRKSHWAVLNGEEKKKHGRISVYVGSDSRHDVTTTLFTPDSISDIFLEQFDSNERTLGVA
jgi:hypothetical protein